MKPGRAAREREAFGTMLAAFALLATLAAGPTPAAPDGPTGAPAPTGGAVRPASADEARAGLGSGAGLPFPPPRLGAPRPPGWVRGDVMLGASAGVLAGDAVVAGLAYGTYRLFVNGGVRPTATNFRNAGLGLAAAALLLPPLGAALGGGWAGDGVRAGGFWRAFLLSVLGQSLALTAGYLTAPTFWALAPVQLALMAPTTSLALRWGASGPRAAPEPLAHAHAPPAAPLALGAPGCPVGG